MGVALNDADGEALSLDNDGDVEQAVSATAATASTAVDVARRRSIPKY